MGYLVFWIITFLIRGCQISGYQDGSKKEILGITTVYRTQNSGYSSQITKEIHGSRIVKGKLLKSGYQYIDSTEGMPPLNCAPATDTCEWTLSSGWKHIATDITEDLDFTIDVGNMVEADKVGCAKDNGGCRFFCRTVDRKPQCYCPNEYVVYKNTSCRLKNDTIRIINTPGSYNIYQEGRYLIIPPKDTGTYLNLRSGLLAVWSDFWPNFYQYIVVSELTEDNQRSSVFKIKIDEQVNVGIVHTSHTLEIDTRTAFTTSHASINFNRPHLTLFQDFGHLSYEIDPVSDNICVSVIYTSPYDNANILFNAYLENGTTCEASKYTDQQFGAWKMRSFTLSLAKDTNCKVILVLNITGKRTKLHSIFGCSPYGNGPLAAIENDASVPVVRQGSDNFTDVTGKCYNGGVFITEELQCVCPEGFTGAKCEKGCGPYYFGDDCSTECSDFASGCSGMIFCKKYLSCLCAPGYRGEHCNISCSAGFYGSSCRQTCGQCRSGSCDSFTGYCHTGCNEDFTPPFCQIPYKYSTVSPSIKVQDIDAVTIEIDENAIEAMRDSVYYVIECKEEEDTYWGHLLPRDLKNTITKMNISDFTPGISYYIRVIYIDTDGNSYQGSKVPTTVFTIPCTVPTSGNHTIDLAATSSSLNVSWKYITNKTNCPITGYTIILQRRWRKMEQNVTLNSYTFIDLLPGVLYEVKIRANTRFGETPFSSYSVKTADHAPLHVTDLRVTKKGSTTLRLSWVPPSFTGGYLKEYVIRYQCTRFFGCDEDCNDISKQVTVQANQSFVDLNGLRPHVKYLIQVAAKSLSIGPHTSIDGLTQDSAPEASPEMSETPITFWSNTSISVQWLPPKHCSLLNGLLVGYRYVLFSKNYTELSSGWTVNTHLTFINLIPQTSYFVHVYVISSWRWNDRKKLIINISTTAASDKVQNLIIYKRGRRVLGVRWALPINSYGEVESFSVSHCQLNNCANAVTVRVAAVPCVPWPTLYCHTITNGLSPNKQYSVSVRARNVLVHDYGNAATAVATTSEGVPEAPLALRMLSRTSDSMTLEWKPPNIFNGVLRSFSVTFKHIESANTTYCCKHFPLQQILVTNEEEKYLYEVTGLIPSSMYIVRVSAKTFSNGPSVSLNIATPPEIKEVIHSPKLIKNNKVKIYLGESISGINRTYLLLVLLPNGNSTSPIWNLEVAEKLQNLVGPNSFYIVGEYTTEDAQTGTDMKGTIPSIQVEIGRGISPYNGTIGVLEDPVLPTEFNVAVALILSYNGASSVGFASAEEEEC